MMEQEKTTEMEKRMNELKKELEREQEKEEDSEHSKRIAKELRFLQEKILWIQDSRKRALNPLKQEDPYPTTKNKRSSILGTFLNATDAFKNRI